MMLRRMVVMIGAVALMAAMTQAATVNYRVRINGSLTGSGAGGSFDETDVGIGTPFTITVEANVPDSPLTGGGWGGTNGYAFNIKDPSGAFAFVDANSNNLWDSTSPMGLHFGGSVNTVGYDVYNETGSALSDYSYGAGPDVWSEMCSGQATWNGVGAWLVLEKFVNDKGSEAVINVMTDAGSVSADSNLPVRVPFGVPEPTTMLLLTVGLGGWLRGTRRQS